MRILLVALLCLGLAAPAAEAQDQPQLSIDQPETQTVVGQPLIVRIKILVPTWLPHPPEFPSLEVPGLMVRLPERASQPVSQRIGSDTWAGVQRTYRLYPLQPGRYEIPAQPVSISYANPGVTEPLVAEVMLDPIRFDAVVPQAARSLDPMIIAREFTLEAEVEGEAEIEVGGAVVRTLTASIAGTTPVLIPPLAPEIADGTLRSYPDEPKITDAEDRGVLSGTRTERVTYLASDAGAATLPAVALDWFNLDTGKVETAEIPAFALNITPGPDQAEASQPFPWRLVLTVLAVVAILILVIRRLTPPVKAWMEASWRRWHASEGYAHRQVLAAIKNQDLSAIYSTLERWARFHPTLSGDVVKRALVTVGHNRHATDATQPSLQDWAALRASYLDTRRHVLAAEKAQQHESDLPALNPDWQEKPAP